MALPEWSAVISIRDNKQNISTLTVYPTGDTHQDVLDSLNNIVSAVQGLTLGVVAKVELSQTVSTSATIPAAGVDNEEGALFTFNDVDGRAYQIRIPSINETLFSPGTGIINGANAAVMTFVGGMTGGLAVTGRDLAIMSFRGGEENFTKAKKRKG